MLPGGSPGHCQLLEQVQAYSKSNIWREIPHREDA